MTDHSNRKRCRAIVVALGLAIRLVQPAAAQDQVVAYRGATIETMGKAGRIENGTLVVKGAKIEAVGRDVPVPDTARVVDVTGRTIMPGLIDPYTVVNISGGDSAPPETRTIVVGGRTITVPSRGSITTGNFTRVADNFYPYGTNYRQPLRSGITQMNLVARGVGQAALARVTPDQPDSMIVNPDGVLFASVTNQSTSLDLLRNGLASVGRSSRPPGSAGSSAGSSQPSSSGGSEATKSASPPGGPTPPSPAAPKELWQQVYEGKSPIVVNVNNAATILHVLKLLEPYKDVRLVLVATGASVYQTLDSLKGRKVSLILRPTIDFVPNSRVRVCVPRLLHEAGIDFAFSLALDQGDLAASQDAPLFPVAYLVKAGLPRDAALAAVTVRPAAILGIDKTHGSIEPGKSANLLVFDGDPLDPASQLRQIVVEGGNVHEN